jgi:hypothetical protein
MNRNTFLAAMLAGLIAAPAMAVRDFQAAPEVNANQKGSLLYWSDVEVKYNAAGELAADTIIELTNDSNSGVYVQLYLVNGDCPLAEERAGAFPFELLERAHPGWNFVDVQIFLSPNKPTFWSAASGNNQGFSPVPPIGPTGDSLQIPPFGNLDADPAPIGSPDHLGTGRLDPDNHLFNLENRTVRGFIVGWAVVIAGQETTHNELAGSAMKIDYQLGAAWEYDAYAYRRLAATAGDGLLELDGVEYNRSPARLQIEFFTVPTIIAQPGQIPVVIFDTDLTMHLIGADFRATGTGPRTTWVQADIWNQNEDRFSGTSRCLTCWDQTLLGDFMGFGVVTANHFLRDNIGTDKGKARLTGLGGVWCPNCHQDNHFGGPTDPFILSTDQAILGVSNKIIAAGAIGLAGSNLTLHGTDDSAVVMWDIVDAARSLEEEETRAMDASRALINQSKLESATLGGRN